MSRRAVASLMFLTRNLCYIYERARSAYEIQPPQLQIVKGTNFILDSLSGCQRFVEFINKQNGKFQSINIEMKDWIDYLDKNYKENSNRKIYLTPQDAKSLAEFSHNWLDSIIDHYNQSDTALIQEQTLQPMYDELKNNLNEFGSEDLKDGINAIANDLPTPAAMILYRVVENVVREYYKKITKGDPGDKPLGAMIHDLEEKGSVDKTLLGYLYFLNKHRIDAAHPYRRYTKEESERILLELKSLIEEI